MTNIVNFQSTKRRAVKSDQTWDSLCSVNKSKVDHFNNAPGLGLYRIKPPRRNLMFIKNQPLTQKT